MAFLLTLNILFGVSGYLLPLPALALAWRAELTGRDSPSIERWRRVASKTALALASAGLVFWIYAVIREIRGTYSYIEPSAAIARWVFGGLIVVAALAEPKVRKYLLLAAVGMFFFFGSSIGDWFI